MACWSPPGDNYCLSDCLCVCMSVRVFVDTSRQHVFVCVCVRSQRAAHHQNGEQHTHIHMYTQTLNAGRSRNPFSSTNIKPCVLQSQKETSSVYTPLSKYTIRCCNLHKVKSISSICTVTWKDKCSQCVFELLWTFFISHKIVSCCPSCSMMGRLFLSWADLDDSRDFNHISNQPH